MDGDILAKSNPRQTLTEHVSCLLNVGISIKGRIGEDILSVVPDSYKNSFFDLLDICALFHDIGKGNIKFQNRIESNNKRKLGGEIDHNLLSPSFLKSFFELKPCSDNIRHILYKAIAYHHNSYPALRPILLVPRQH